MINLIVTRQQGTVYIVPMAGREQDLMLERVDNKIK